MSDAKRSKMGPCSVGTFLNSLCLLLAFCRSSKLENISDMLDKELLEWRVGTELTTVCTHHKHQYLNRYARDFGSRCCDPFKLHKKVFSKGVRTIEVDFAQEHRSLGLVPGQALCTRCRKDLTSARVPVDRTTLPLAAHQNTTTADVASSEEENSDYRDDFTPPEEQLAKVNRIGAILSLPPIEMHEIKSLSPTKKITIHPAKNRRNQNSIRENTT